MPKTIHPALANAPKTPLEAINRIRAYAKTRTFANAVYQDEKGNLCAIGLFFTQAQLDDIKAQRLNQVAIGKSPRKPFVGSLPNVHLAIGKKNIEAMTGLPIAICCSIQDTLDLSGRTALLEYLDRLEERFEAETT